jgi:N-acetylglutamate synthase/N-acetylornithine aminotransferase
MARLTARGLGVPTGSVFVCSTGRIGERLPMDPYAAASQRRWPRWATHPQHGNKAAWAILTRRHKAQDRHRALRVRGQDDRIAGFARARA